jgi:hypothetical protein
MELLEFLETAEVQEGTCPVLISGITELYLVPLGDQFSTLFAQERIFWLPPMDAIPQRLKFDFESAQYKARQRNVAAGVAYECSLGFAMSGNVSEWLRANAEGRWWLIFRKGEEWFIAGDEDVPFRLNRDYGTGTAPGQKQGFDLELVSTQMQAFFRYKKATYTLDPAHWELKEPYIGTWSTSNPADINNYMLYEGNIYWRELSENPHTDPPSGNTDYQDLGPLQPFNPSESAVVVGTVVLVDGSLYLNTSGNNNYEYTVAE